MSENLNDAPVLGECPAAIRASHRQGLAIVYARQSSTEQLREHTGSTGEQLALAELPRKWGWPDERIKTIDDFGLSGTTTNRPGFAQMLELIERGEVTLLIARAVDRISRDPADAAMFLKKALKAKLLLHVDGRLYDTATATDNVIELFMLHFQTLWGWLDNLKRVQIFQTCKARKALQGKAVTRPPIGYVRVTKGEWIKDPDIRVQEAVRRVFDLYLELKSIKRVVRFMFKNQLQFPRRSRGQLRWEVGISSAQLATMLRNPNYTNRYVFHRIETSHGPKHRMSQRPETEWISANNHHAPYITDEEWQRIREGSASRRAAVRPAIGKGSGLLQGLIWCGRCRGWMNTLYWSREAGHRRASYACRRVNRAGEPIHEMLCRSRLIDHAVTEAVFASLSPIRLESALALIEQQQMQDSGVRKTHARQLQHADDEVDAARQRYKTADPRNKAVVAELGHDWEQAIHRRDELKRVLASVPDRPIMLVPAMAQELVNLSRDARMLWEADTTTNEDRKNLLRTMLSKVVVTGSTKEAVELQLHWVGGLHQSIRALRSQGIDPLLVKKRRQGKTSQAIADELNAEGHRDGYGKLFSASTVRQKLHTLGANLKVERHTMFLALRDLLCEGAAPATMLEELQRRTPRAAPRTLAKLNTEIASLRRGVSGVPALPPEVSKVRLRGRQAPGSALSPAKQAPPHV